ncbi:hypothetical protein ACN28S_35615 [Cystobacter fuscus]
MCHRHVGSWRKDTGGGKRAPHRPEDNPGAPGAILDGSFDYFFLPPQPLAPQPPAPQLLSLDFSVEGVAVPSAAGAAEPSAGTALAA